MPSNGAGSTSPCQIELRTPDDFRQRRCPSGRRVTDLRTSGRLAPGDRLPSARDARPRTPPSTSSSGTPSSSGGYGSRRRPRPDAVVHRSGRTWCRSNLRRVAGATRGRCAGQAVERRGRTRWGGGESCARGGAPGGGARRLRGQRSAHEHGEGAAPECDGVTPIKARARRGGARARRGSRQRRHFVAMPCHLRVCGAERKRRGWCRWIDPGVGVSDRSRWRHEGLGRFDGVQRRRQRPWPQAHPVISRASPAKRAFPS